MSNTLVAKSLKTLADEVSGYYLERRGVIEAIMLAILTKEHVYILGPPGTGKSDMARSIFHSFKGASYFETLLSKTRPDQAVLGPWNLPLLREHGDYQRKIAGYLPTKNFIFLDEIGKMSPTLGHELLPALNERIVHEVVGEEESYIDIPLYTAICASNELIVIEGEDAVALWDRLLFRTVVDNIQENGAFKQLLKSTRKFQSTVTIDFADLQHAIDVEVPAVHVPDAVLDNVIELRSVLREQEIVVSDRRWKQGTKVLQASAYYDERDEATDDDIHALRYILWDTPEQKAAVERACLQVSNPLAEKVMQAAEAAEAIARKVRSMRGKSAKEKAEYGIEANGKLKLATSDLTGIRNKMTSEGRSPVSVDEALARVAAIKQTVMVDLLDIDD